MLTFSGVRLFCWGDFLSFTIKIWRAYIFSGIQISSSAFFHHLPTVPSVLPIIYVRISRDSRSAIFQSAIQFILLFCNDIQPHTVTSKISEIRRFPLNIEKTSPISVHHFRVCNKSLSEARKLAATKSFSSFLISITFSGTTGPRSFENGWKS